MTTQQKLVLIRKSQCWTRRVYKPKDELQKEIEDFYRERKKTK